MSDLMDAYLNGSSPYITDIIYDVGRRFLVLKCANNPDDLIPTIQVVFEGIRTYSEETIDEEYDDNCVDSVIGINWVRDRVLCIRTEKKEIIMEIEKDPKSMRIA